MRKILLKTVIQEQQNVSPPLPDVERFLSIPISQLIATRNIVVITGVRRCGKSTLLQHLRKQHQDNHYYLNFDDERLLDFTVSDFQLMMEVFIELFDEEKVCYFDEIQNIIGWERFARRLHDQGYKLFVTGSNANMLSQEMGTHLTGRHIALALYPFSFSEFCDYKKISLNAKQSTTVMRAKFSRSMRAYINIGGFPQYIREELISYLQSLYENILYRDIIARYKLPSDQAIRQLAFYFASNVGKCCTYNALRKYLRAGSSNTIADYCQYLENAYLFFLIKRFHYSLKVQSASPKKVYAIDTGMAHAIGFRSSDDAGRMLENVVFIELKRRGVEIFYHAEKKECDFVVCDTQNRIQELLQVCCDLSDAETREREVAGLLEAMQLYKRKNGTIISLSEEDEFVVTVKRTKYSISVVPIWVWLR